MDGFFSGAAQGDGGSDPFLGKNIFLLGGDGASIGTSKSIFLIDTGKTFQADAPLFAATVDLNDGTLIVGQNSGQPVGQDSLGTIQAQAFEKLSFAEINDQFNNLSGGWNAGESINENWSVSNGSVIPTSQTLEGGVTLQVISVGSPANVISKSELNYNKKISARFKTKGNPEIFYLMFATNGDLNNNNDMAGLGVSLTVTQNDPSIQIISNVNGTFQTLSNKSIDWNEITEWNDLVIKDYGNIVSVTLNNKYTLTANVSPAQVSDGRIGNKVAFYSRQNGVGTEIDSIIIEKLKSTGFNITGAASTAPTTPHAVTEFGGPDDLRLDPETVVIAVDVYGNGDSIVNGVTFFTDRAGEGNGVGLEGIVTAGDVTVKTTTTHFIDNWSNGVGGPAFTGGTEGFCRSTQ